MQHTQKSSADRRRFSTSPRVLCILVFTCAYFVSLAIGVPQASAAALSAPGGNVSDPVVRQVDIARPAVVRIVTTLGGQLTVHFNSTVSATFPVNGGSYPLALSGSGAFISAHGELLTADHVVNPPRDSGLDSALFSEAAQDVADYINAHFQVPQPYTANDAFNLLVTGSLPSTTSYSQPTSVVYLSTAYSGAINATRLETVPANTHATVDRIEAQSSFNANDVAIIHVNGMDNMPSILLGDSSQVTEQDNLTVIGYPGLADLSNSPSQLLTSSINKVYVSALKTTDSGAPVIEVGGNVEHGDSGGPALDEKGNIVGIVSFGFSGVDGDFGETSFLQASNSAVTLIKSQGINTNPGSFENAWAQAINDYSSSASGHWQKASQELQSLAQTYPNFQGITPYLAYAQRQAGQEQSAAGGISSTLWVALLVVLLLLVLGGGIFLILRRNTRPVVVAPGAAQTYGAYQQPSGIYPPQSSGMYPQQPSGIYPPGFAGYSANASYAQPPFSAMPGSQPVMPAGTPYANYTSPAAYGALAGQLPQTPQAIPGGTPLPLPASTPEQNVAFPAPPAHTPQPEIYEVPQTPLPSWTMQQTAAPAPEQTPLPEAVAGTLSEVLEKSATYALPIDQAEILSARTLAVPPAETPASPGNFWSPPPAETPTGEEEQTIRVQPASTAFSVPKRPSVSAVPEEHEATAVAEPLNGSTYLAPCGHANEPGMYFCRVCGQPIVSSFPANGNGHT